MNLAGTAEDKQQRGEKQTCRKEAAVEAVSTEGPREERTDPTAFISDEMIERMHSDPLSEGEMGPWVILVNQSLRILGYEVPRVSAIITSETEAAVRDFQRDRGIPVDGIVGPDTMLALRSAYSKQHQTSVPQQADF